MFVAIPPFDSANACVNMIVKGSMEGELALASDDIPYVHTCKMALSTCDVLYIHTSGMKRVTVARDSQYPTMANRAKLSQ